MRCERRSGCERNEYVLLMRELLMLLVFYFYFFFSIFFFIAPMQTWPPRMIIYTRSWIDPCRRENRRLKTERDSERRWRSTSMGIRWIQNGCRAKRSLSERKESQRRQEIELLRASGSNAVFCLQPRIDWAPPMFVPADSTRAPCPRFGLCF